jgi:hypothetical protein
MRGVREPVFRGLAPTPVANALPLSAPQRMLFRADAVLASRLFRRQRNILSLPANRLALRQGGNPLIGPCCNASSSASSAAFTSFSAAMASCTCSGHRAHMLLTPSQKRPARCLGFPRGQNPVPGSDRVAIDAAFLRVGTARFFAGAELCQGLN